ncbi:MAG: DUF1275 domain-containing protein [Solirubrobacterales bacterium]|nr:DUF1275 domain-containing protein [Solirubrobacterales bacterium]MBV9423750.1 DUF1275 domain-containing protein [Solirubrobacterales bacterium]MBV9798720.1 DUF1275 domain-containing protein [Solirubrobacterales bacterium]
MNSVAGSASAGGFGGEAGARLPGVKSVKHPLTRALLVLTFTTGLVDAVSYLGLGRVFTANMTGNVVLLGFGVAGSGGLPVVGPALSLAAFLLGSVAGGALVKRLQKRHPMLLARGLAIEVSLLAAAAIVASATNVRAGDAMAYAVIVLLAFAMGVRGTIVRHMGVPDLSTVVLTMTLTAFASGSPLAGGSREDSIRRLAAALAMFAGAVAGALLLKTSLVLPLAVAAALALVTWLVYVPPAVRRGK